MGNPIEDEQVWNIANMVHSNIKLLFFLNFPLNSFNPISPLFYF